MQVILRETRFFANILISLMHAITYGHFRGHSHDFREQNKILNVK